MGIKLLVPVIASILILGLANQEVFGPGPTDLDCMSIVSGLWSQTSTWDCGAGDSDGLPSGRANAIIKSGHTVTVDTDVDRSPGPENFVHTLTIEAGATLKVNCGKIFKVDELINLSLITVENCGDTEVAIFTNPGIFNNNCGGSLTIMQTSSSSLGGDIGPSGSNQGFFNNYGTFELGPEFPSLGPFDNSGIFNDGGSLINVIESGPGDNFDGNAIQPAANMCAVGGEFIGIDSVSILVAGAQYTAAWMIPVLVSGIGIAIVIARKF